MPQAACSRYGLQIGAYSAPFVKVGRAPQLAAALPVECCCTALGSVLCGPHCGVA